MGILLVLLGGGVLAGLFHAAESLGFDTLLVASKALYNVIAGLRSVGLGVGQTLLGIAQMLGFTALAVISIAAVLAIISGAVRIGSHTLPRLTAVWNLLSQALYLALRFLAVPLAGRHEPVQTRNSRPETHLEPSLRSALPRSSRAA